MLHVPVILFRVLVEMVPALALAIVASTHQLAVVLSTPAAPQQNAPSAPQAITARRCVWRALD
jgi:hypothetical protein